MIGMGQQFEYILRDESVHLAFGSHLIDTIKEEHPEIWTLEFQEEISTLIAQSVELEKKYIEDCCPNGLLGTHKNEFIKYMEYIGDRRLVRLGLSKMYFEENPFPWMSETMDLAKEKNFFETRVTEYQSAGSLSWD